MKQKVNKVSIAMMLAVLGMGAFVAEEASGTYPKGYYNSLNGKCGVSLMEAIKQLSAGHKVISYGDNTWNAFKTTDVRTVNGVDYWWDMYSSNLVRVSSGHGGLNIEHSVANSWWDGTKNDAYKDIVHLNPSDATANNRKSNYPLGEIANVTWDNGVTFVGSPVSGQGGGSSYVYEPTDEYKGDFARVFMYMFTTYKDMTWGTRFTWMYDVSNPLMLKPWAQELLLRWSASDVVSQKELDRNDGIYKEQYNRNPFIDLPDLADHIWGSKKNEPYKVEGLPDIPDVPGDEEVYTWLAQENTDVDNGWEYDNRNIPSPLTYVWKWKVYDGKGYLCGSAFYNGTPYEAEAYAWGPVIDMKNVSSAKFTFDHAAKYQTTLSDLCKVAVMDMSVNGEGYIQTYDILKWPAKGSWTFSNAGDIDLSHYGETNSKIRIGFLYKSSAEGADTWEINNAKLTLQKKTTAIKVINNGENTDDSCLVEVWGNNILVPEGAMIFDLNGRRVNGENLGRGVYIVTKPTFSKAVKVMIK